MLVGFHPYVMGRWLVDNWRVIRGTDGELYRWWNGVYTPAEEDISAAVLAVHSDRYIRGRTEDVLNWLKLTPSRDVSQPLPEGLLNLKNGVLNVETLELMPHSPNYLTRVQLPVAWNPDAKCIAIDNFLSESVAPDSVGLAWEIFGYCLSGTNKYQRAFLLYGPGGNGKSKLLFVLRELLGKDNFCSNTLQALSSNRFRCAQLYGKLANVCGDIGEEMIDSTETFKQLVGGDAIEVEKKGQDPFTFENRAALIFSANGFPKVSDHSQGFFERVVFLSLPVKFRGTEREIPGIEKQLCVTEELEGALVRSVEGLRRLNERGGFEVTGSSAQLNKEYQENVDSVAGFVGELCVVGVGSDCTIRGSQLYSYYQLWCSQSNVPAKSAKRFHREIRHRWVDAGIVQERLNGGYPTYVGVSLVNHPTGGQFI